MAASLHGPALSPADIEQFIRDGYVVLREAFPREVAQRIRAALCKELQLDPNNRAGWKESVVHLKKSHTGPPFSEAFTPRLNAAFDQVMGVGRYRPLTHLGWWPVSFPGFDAPPWHAPDQGWHVDGIQFHHRVNSPDQGLLPIFLLSDIGPGDGGTAIDLGSHRIAARILNEAGEAGLEVGELCKKVATHPFLNVIETNGRAGDVALMHPFMRHARSMNTGQSVRFICNPCVTLHEPMNLARANAADYSPVEQAIVAALREPAQA
ncbi:MAG: phytanoyl-CoA dioxygenase family protein [Planctomycetota bacterium]